MVEYYWNTTSVSVVSGAGGSAGRSARGASLWLLQTGFCQLQQTQLSLHDLWGTVQSPGNIRARLDWRWEQTMAPVRTVPCEAGTFTETLSALRPAGSKNLVEMNRSETTTGGSMRIYRLHVTLVFSGVVFVSVVKVLTGSLSLQASQWRWLVSCPSTRSATCCWRWFMCCWSECRCSDMEE